MVGFFCECYELNAFIRYIEVTILWPLFTAFLALLVILLALLAILLALFAILLNIFYSSLLPASEQRT